MMSWMLHCVLSLMTQVRIDQVQKLTDVSCVLGQFPAETNAGQTSICGSEWAARAETKTEQRGRCRGEAAQSLAGGLAGSFDPLLFF